MKGVLKCAAERKGDWDYRGTGTKKIDIKDKYKGIKRYKVDSICQDF